MNISPFNKQTGIFESTNNLWILRCVLCKLWQSWLVVPLEIDEIQILFDNFKFPLWHKVLQKYVYFDWILASYLEYIFTFYIFLSSKMFSGNFHFNEGKIGFTVKGHLENIWLLHFQKLQTADILGEHIFKFLTYSCQIQINNSIFKYSNFHHYQNLRIYIGN